MAEINCTLNQMLINLTKAFSAVNLHIDLTLPDDPEESPAQAILKCRSYYLSGLRGRPDLIPYLEQLVLEEVHKINPDYIIAYTNNDFFGQQELSLKIQLKIKT
jgi:hypothetical protein